jgi:hypothetical protein
VHLISQTQTILAFLPRTMVALVLAFSLISVTVPFSSASVGQLCTMQCCAGLEPHAAGSCHVKVSPPGRVATTQHGSDHPCATPRAGAGAINGVIAGVIGMKEDGDGSYLDLDDVTVDASRHCNTDSQSQDLSAPSHNDFPQSTSIAEQSFAKPCPPECGTGALSSGMRSSRKSVALAYNARPRPPTLVRERRYSNSSFFVTSTYCNQLRPRGPPFGFS